LVLRDVLSSFMRTRGSMNRISRDIFLIGVFVSIYVLLMFLINAHEVIFNHAHFLEAYNLVDIVTFTPLFLSMGLAWFASRRIKDLKAQEIERKKADKERKELEIHLSQAYKMEAIGTLAGGIAHDFNNILGSIIGYSELCQMKIEEAGLHITELDSVLDAADRAKDLVGQILAFSRQKEIKKRPLRISAVVKDSLKILRASLPSTIEIHQNINDPGVALCDMTQIHQLVMNLCTNAGHAMSEHGGILEISLSKEYLEDSVARKIILPAGSYIRLSVKDTGNGIPQEIMHRIFDPYFTSKPEGVGTGMGLAVSDSIVKGHDGAITVESQVGKGSTFNVFLPSIDLKPVDIKKIAPVVSSGSGTILFIDDEAPLAEIGKEMLQRIGYDVVSRTSSVEALELFRAMPYKFDLVITDQTMPNMTGDKLSMQLLKIRPDIPVILCTGYSESILGKDPDWLGIREFLMKPVAFNDLASSVKRVMDNSIAT
jgi:signal transduction histidine kinase/CheY-like chemotaxis protein